MSWKLLINRAEHLVGGASKVFHLESIGKCETEAVLTLIKKVSVQCKHPLINTFRAYIDESAFRDIVPAYIRKLSPSKPDSTKPPECLLIPIVGQSLSTPIPENTESELSILNQQKKISNIFTTVNFAIAMHRSILEVSSPCCIESVNSNSYTPSCVNDECDSDIATGNKLAILAGDILMASASLSLASFQHPKIVAVMSAAIAKAVEAEFSDFMSYFNSNKEPQNLFNPSSSEMAITTLLPQWLSHISLRHGSMLGASCESVIMLASSHVFDSPLSTAARRFGVTWACISRLIDEYEYFTKISCKPRVKLGGSFISNSQCIGFISGGLLEPTLADCFALLPSSETPNSPSIMNLYTEAAGKLSLDLRKALNDLLPIPDSMNPSESLLRDFVHLILHHEVFHKQ